MIDFSRARVCSGDAVSRQTAPECDIGRNPGATNRAPGHLPSWRYHEVPDGLTMCVRCWRVIAASQLVERACNGPRRRWRDESGYPGSLVHAP